MNFLPQRRELLRILNANIGEITIMHKLPSHEHLQVYFERSDDLFGWFSPDDILLYANARLRNLFNLSSRDQRKLSFAEIIRDCFNAQRGPLIETDCVDDWLQHAQTKRRSAPHRRFQLDTTDGRWYMVSETCDTAGYLFMHGVDITDLVDRTNDLTQEQRKLRRLANTDALTGVFNRRAFVTAIENHFEQVQRDPACLILIDIDHFKQINDDFGHPTGDQSLVRLTEIFSQHIRPGDTLARIGGDEFALFLRGATGKAALDVTARIRKALQKKPLHIEVADKEFDVCIRCSFGIAFSSATADNFENLYSQADDALIEAKQKGRNQAVAQAESS
ncbi:hypothetical protein CWE12_00140 [Aliidiomarina sedimenti]|uniref:diguanylate cyclase n=2 Tax=Aliidiomarina sedimenti TaxID=1933879 RepID=A0ABY0C1U5_9GAMM|nr:hypothetical protein CWE12_00140 [Aliidiomarina sedimenti]